jgi:hypothetical protein
VVRVQPEGLRHDLFKLQLDLKHILAGRQAGTVADAENVRVDREGLLMKCGVENHVRRLPPDAGQLLELLAGSGDSAPMIADERFRQSDDVLRLGVEQADRLDRVANAFLAKRDHLFRRLHPLEQGPGRDIHARIGRLCRQHHRHQQGVRVHISELGSRGRVLLRQPAEEFENLIPGHNASMTSRIV